VVDVLTSIEYMLPNDEREQDRLGMYDVCREKTRRLMNRCLDLQHHTFKIICDGRLHLAPISKPQRVLDLATGTGIWAIEFGNHSLYHAQKNMLSCSADQYPESRVIGTDLSPIQPDQ
jgi:ubiquinone/menaquinone biosynthesis C-methylase UbiE